MLLWLVIVQPTSNILSAVTIIYCLKMQKKTYYFSHQLTSCSSSLINLRISHLKISKIVFLVKADSLKDSAIDFPLLSWISPSGNLAFHRGSSAHGPIQKNVVEPGENRNTLAIAVGNFTV